MNSLETLMYGNINNVKTFESNRTLNSSDFDTLDCSCFMTPTYRYIQLVTAVILFVMTLFGNSLILGSLIKFPEQFKGNLFIFIGNLAAADLLLGLSMSLFIAEGIAPDLLNIWYFCIAKSVSYLCPLCTSLLTLLCISVDRYMAIMHPFKHLLKTTNKKLIVAFCIFVWTLAILICSGMVLELIIVSPDDDFVCSFGAIFSTSKSLILACILLLVLMLNAVLYGIVARKIRTNKRPGYSVTNRQHVKTKLMMNVFVIFIICYLPFIICCFLVVSTQSIRQDAMCVREYAAMIGRTKATLNWIVFGLDNQRFRTAFKALLTGKSCCNTNAKLSSISKNVQTISGKGKVNTNQENTI